MNLYSWKGKLQWKQYIPYNWRHFWKKCFTSCHSRTGYNHICIWTEISDQHRQMNHVSHAFRELLPHTVLADMLHDYQIQCIGTGQQTKFKHSLKYSEIKTTER